MCGIAAFINNKSSGDNIEKRKYLLELSKKIRHRGPDWNGIYMDKKVIITHERLSIVGIDHGSQPIENQDMILSVNGEIYNYKTLYSDVLHNKYIPTTESDCEIIINLYQEFGIECIKMLDGVFSFVLYDKKKSKILIGRDPIGVNPLYYGITPDKELMFASEMKVLNDDCEHIDSFPPGHYSLIDINNMETITSFSSLKQNFTQYYNPMWSQSKFNPELNEEILFPKIRNVLTRAVEKRLMADVPFGVLLSGGLDSSIIASIASRLIKDTSTAWGNKLHSFSIGLKDAPDLKYARIVADYLGTIHHEFHFNVQEGIDCLEDLIYHLETYDVTTIRASTPMFLLSRKIKSLGIKMVLSGEGADEMLGGYLYFHNAPSNQEFHNECISRVKNLHNFDCLRANKSTMSWGLEARVPFLDKSFLELIMPISPELKLKNGKEKYIVRQAFHYEKDVDKYLPDEILWRQKEQFSDGVGYNWIDGVKEYIEKNVSDQQFDEDVKDYQLKNSKDIPKNKEELYFRKIFDRLFSEKYDRSSIVPRWIPKMDWDGVSYDPSGRAQKVHINSNK